MSMEKELKKLCEICHEIGYMSAIADTKETDEMADRIAEFVTKQFLEKWDLVEEDEISLGKPSEFTFYLKPQEERK